VIDPSWLFHSQISSHISKVGRDTLSSASRGLSSRDRYIPDPRVRHEDVACWPSQASSRCTVLLRASVSSVGRRLIRKRGHLGERRQRFKPLRVLAGALGAVRRRLGSPSWPPEEDPRFDEPPGGVGVREPLRPRPTPRSGTAMLELPVDDEHATG
jgi:hypothetical protein